MKDNTQYQNKKNPQKLKQKRYQIIRNQRHAVKRWYVYTEGMM
jgi:hypothetical protein